jgi:hypothetical protein
MKFVCFFLLLGLYLSVQGESPAPAPVKPAVVDWKMLDRTSAEISSGMHNAKISYPADLQALNNKPVTIVGFMTPFEDLSDMTQFLLMPSSGGCFFCNPPSMTQVLMVDQLKDSKKRHDFIGDAIMVTGTLRLYSKDSKHPAHLAEFIYALDDAKVEVCDGKSTPAP